MSNHGHLEIDNYQLEQSRWAAGRNTLFLAALISVIACIAGYITDPERFFRSYTVAFAFTSAIGLGAFFFVMAMYLAGNAAGVTVRRIMKITWSCCPWERSCSCRSRLV